MQTAQRISNFRESVIRMMTRLAIEHNAINLSQGFPDFDTPLALKEAAVKAIMEGNNQYSPTWGYTPLREKLAELYTSYLGWQLDPNQHVTVTCGVTEAMNPSDVLFGDERLLDFAQQHRQAGAADLVRMLCEAVHSHAAVWTRASQERTLPAASSSGSHSIPRAVSVASRSSSSTLRPSTCPAAGWLGALSVVMG